jgi:hypothetical protein
LGVVTGLKSALKPDRAEEPPLLVLVLVLVVLEVQAEEAPEL